MISQSLLTMQPKIPYSENRHLPHTKCSLTFPFSSTLLKLKPPLSIPVCIPPPFFFCSHSHYTLVHLRIHPFSFPLTNEQNVIKHIWLISASSLPPHLQVLGEHLLLLLLLFERFWGKKKLLKKMFKKQYATVDIPRDIILVAGWNLIDQNLANFAPNMLLHDSLFSRPALWVGFT